MMRLPTLNCPQAPSNLLPPGRLISQGCLIATLLVGCGAQPVSNSPEPSPAASPSQQTTSPEASDDENQQDGSSSMNGRHKDAAEFDAEAPREEPEQEPSTFDGGPRPQKKKERFSLMEDLQAEAQRLEESFHPEELSCSGAAPHRDAICSLAERICALDTPSTVEGAQDCEKAKKSCSDARARYEKKCT